MKAPEIEAQLDLLQQESEQRRTELRAIAAQLPETRSRRVVLTTMVRDFRTNADLSDIVSRALRKLGRAPRALLRRLQRA